MRFLGSFLGSLAAGAAALSGAVQKTKDFFSGGAQPVRPSQVLRIFRPAQGETCIRSRRRMMRKEMVAMHPKLRSGRQWVKYRKALKRRTGIDLLAIPSYHTQEA